MIYDNKRELEEVVEYCLKDNYAGLKRTLFYPIRTNNISNFLKDVSIPCTIDTAQRVNNIVVKIFLSLLSLPLDLLTFPVRLINLCRLPFKKIEEHQLLLYLNSAESGKKLDTMENYESLLQAEQVIVKIEAQEKFSMPIPTGWEATKDYSNEGIDKNKLLDRLKWKNLHNGSCDATRDLYGKKIVNFVEQPFGPTSTIESLLKDDSDRTNK